MNAGKVLFDAGLQNSGGTTADRGVQQLPRRDGRGRDQPGQGLLGGRHGPDLREHDVARPARPTSRSGRRSSTAFSNLTDPANPGAQVVLKIMKKEELRNVDGSDSLHPNRSGDVVVVLKPPYQFDAATFGQTIAFSQFFGQHGYLPETVDLASGVNMHATFVAAGPGIRHQGPVQGVRAIDLAPTISLPAGHPRPDQRPRQDPLQAASRTRASTRKPPSSTSATSTAS